jgi:hypothetical protein
LAAFAFTDGYVAINSVDRSAYVRSVALHVEGAELDASNMASNGWMTPISGLRSGNVQITFNQDVADSAIDDIMWALLWTTTTFELRATDAAVGANNPKYTGSFLVREWTPLSGSVGDLAEVSVTFPTSGAVTRSESA